MMENYVLQAILVLVALAAWEFVKLGVAKFFKNTVDTSYVTTTQCAGCQGKSEVEEKSVREELSQVRRITLLIAMKVGIPEHEIVKLVKQ